MSRLPPPEPLGTGPPLVSLASTLRLRPRQNQGSSSSSSSSSASSSATPTYSRAANGCVVCPSSAPVCPACPTGQVCSLSLQSCDACPQVACISNSAVTSGIPGPAASSSASASSSSSAPASGTSDRSLVGPIIGATVGGVALVAFVAFLIFWCRRKRRRRQNSPALDEKLAPVAGSPYTDNEKRITPRNGGGEVLVPNSGDAMFSPVDPASPFRTAPTGEYLTTIVDGERVAIPTSATSTSFVNVPTTALASSELSALQQLHHQQSHEQLFQRNAPALSSTPTSAKKKKTVGALAISNPKFLESSYSQATKNLPRGRASLHERQMNALRQMQMLEQAQHAAALEARAQHHHHHQLYPESMSTRHQQQQLALLEQQEREARAYLHGKKHDAEHHDSIALYPPPQAHSTAADMRQQRRNLEQVGAQLRGIERAQLGFDRDLQATRDRLVQRQLLEQQERERLYGPQTAAHAEYLPVVRVTMGAAGPTTPTSVGGDAVVTPTTLADVMPVSPAGFPATAPAHFPAAAPATHDPRVRSLTSGPPENMVSIAYIPGVTSRPAASRSSGTRRAHHPRRSNPQGPPVSARVTSGSSSLFSYQPFYTSRASSSGSASIELSPAHSLSGAARLRGGAVPAESESESEDSSLTSSDDEEEGYVDDDDELLSSAGFSSLGVESAGAAAAAGAAGYSSEEYYSTVPAGATGSGIVDAAHMMAPSSGGGRARASFTHPVVAPAPHAQLQSPLQLHPRHTRTGSALARPRHAPRATTAVSSKKKKRLSAASLTAASRKTLGGFSMKVSARHFDKLHDDETDSAIEPGAAPESAAVRRRTASPFDSDSDGGDARAPLAGGGGAPRRPAQYPDSSRAADADAANTDEYYYGGARHEVWRAPPESSEAAAAEPGEPARRDKGKTRRGPTRF